jgi:uncharacterized protein (DUF302 family)
VSPRTPVRPGAAQRGHLSRVAGMAVAVGLGMAVVSNAGLASADTGDNSKDDSSANSAGASNTPASHTTSSAQGSSAESTAKGGEDAGSVATVGSSDKQGGSASAGSSSASNSSDDARDGAVKVSGGAAVTSGPSGSGSSSSSSAQQTSGDQTSSKTDTQPKNDSISSSSPPHAVTATTPSAARSQRVEPRASSDAGARRNATPTATSNVKAARPAVSVAGQSVADAPAPTAAVPTAQLREVSTASTTVAPLAAKSSTAASLVVQPLASRTKPVTQAVTTSVDDFMTQAVAAVSSLVGYAPAAQNAPTAPQPSPALWTVLAWARRELDHPFVNHAPQLQYNAADDTQSADGVVSGVDQDGDPLSYKVVQNPTSGTVQVNSDGTFTYTPSPALADSGGTDSFVVTVSDQPPSPFGGLTHLVDALTGQTASHTTTQTITVPVAAPTSGSVVIPDQVERLDIVVPNTTYADLKARFEAAVPVQNAALTALLATGTPNYDALVAATNANAPQGFIRYFTLSAGALSVWGYAPADTQSTQYLLGNPVVTAQLDQQNPSTLLASPLRAQIYQASDGSVHLVVDLPSSRFDSFDDPEITAIGDQQDESLAALLTSLNVPVPNELIHSATPAPAPATAPQDTSFLGQLIGSVKHTFFNHAPTVGYDETQNVQGRGGVLTGALDASDPDGDALSYKVDQGPANGSVVVNADGTFTYTPSAALASTGGTDSFVVTVNDGANPLQGALGSLLPASSAHTTSQTINLSVHAPNTGITVYTADVNRLDIIVPNTTYADFKAKFAAAVPGFSPQVLQILGAGVPNLDALKAAINTNAPNGFLTFTTINTGALLTVAGAPADSINATQYLFGNPVFAEQMYKEDRSTQLYAPLRATIYEAADGTVHLVLDQPSTSFDSFGDPTIDGVGVFLDGEVANLLTVLGAPVPDVLTEASA